MPRKFRRNLTAQNGPRPPLAIALIASLFARYAFVDDKAHHPVARTIASGARVTRMNPRSSSAMAKRSSLDLKCHRGRARAFDGVTTASPESRGQIKPSCVSYCPLTCQDGWSSEISTLSACMLPRPTVNANGSLPSAHTPGGRTLFSLPSSATAEVMVEFYVFSVRIRSRQRFPATFFPTLPPRSAGVSYLVWCRFPRRLLGAFVFGHRRSAGRKFAFIINISSSVSPRAATGLLPVLDDWDCAPVLLVVLRILQGMDRRRFGGASALSLNSPETVRAFWMFWQTLACCCPRWHFGQCDLLLLSDSFATGGWRSRCCSRSSS